MNKKLVPIAVLATALSIPECLSAQPVSYNIPTTVPETVDILPREFVESIVFDKVAFYSFKSISLITTDSKLSIHLDMDSLSIFSLKCDCEDFFNISLSGNIYEEYFSVGDLIDEICSLT